jgi:hypothetical protein
MPAISEDEILEFLHAIEDGDITIEGDSGYAGDATYKASNGWTIVVFNDCDDWDYIESIKTDDGREIQFDEILNTMPRVDNYRPSDEVASTRYGIGTSLQQLKMPAEDEEVPNEDEE